MLAVVVIGGCDEVVRMDDSIECDHLAVGDRIWNIAEDVSLAPEVMYVRRVLVTQRGRSGFEVYTEPVTSPYMQTFLVVFALEMRHQVELNAYTHMHRLHQIKLCHYIFGKRALQSKRFLTHVVTFNRTALKQRASPKLCEYTTLWNNNAKS